MRARLKPVHLRHEEIQQDKIGLAVMGLLESALPISGHDHPKPGILQQCRHNTQIARIVIHNQNDWQLGVRY